jgi:hypothetical protein
MNFKDLKKSSSKNIDSLINELEKTKSGGAKYIDDRYWSIPMDEKTGNGTALIRFLPVSAGDKIPWVSLYSHGFQGPGGWYIENSLTTLGQADPVSEANTELWNTGIDANKEIVRKRKRKQHFVSNILVLSDPKNPQNEGKVFLFKYGKKLFSKIQEKLQPEAEFGEAPVDVFDFWKGANFRLKVKKVEGYPNYDSSLFEAPGPLFDGDETKLEKLWNTQYSLEAEVSPERFKSYDELKARLNKVLGNKPGSVAASAAMREEAPAARREAPAPKLSGENAPPWKEETTDELEDEALSYFKNLADE